MDETDQVLVARARTGDRAAFDALVVRHRRRVHRLCGSIVRHPEDALELTQDVLLKAYRNLPSLKEDAGFGTWLYRIAVNLCLDFIALKRQQSERIAPDDDAADRTASDEGFLTGHVPHPETLLDAQDTVRAVRRALDQLSPTHRMAIVLREIEGLSYEEIAQTMECSLGTVMSRLFYARKRLQTLLGPFMDDTP